MDSWSNTSGAKQVPVQFSSIIKKTIELLLTEPKDTRGIFLTGSVAGCIL